ncbi:MAG: alpha-amylase family glycosyl hydrolase [Cellulomonadaceae bacterium]
MNAQQPAGQQGEPGGHQEPSWVRHAVWWQVYPLGFVGAYPAEPAPGPEEHRLRRIVTWFDHAVELGASGIALGPVFDSSTHGYDTVDHTRIDPRLGTEVDFEHLVHEAHSRGLRVLLDGVFNHVGTDFPMYRRALADGPSSAAASWFVPDSDGYRTFEGHRGLVELNHETPAVVDYVVDVMIRWLARGADGWRLDAAYATPPSFWTAVLPRVRAAQPEAWFVGEVIHGDYAGIVAASGLDSLTQYELWKAIWSAINDRNLFELAWALDRHDEFLETFVPMTFVGNHDVTRIASQIADPRHLVHALVVLFTVGGTPSVYAGDELGWRGVKEERFGGDDAVRPEFPFGGPGVLDPAEASVLSAHQALIGLRRRHPWLHRARTRTLELTNECVVYEVAEGGHRIVVGLNLGDQEHPFTPDGELLLASSGAPHEAIPAHGWALWDVRPSS